MNRIKSYTLISLFVCLVFSPVLCSSVFAVNNEKKLSIDNQYIHSESTIKSIKIFNTDSDLSNPIIELDKNESVTLVFDDLGENTNSYSYSVIHCTKDWQESGLITSDYMDGFEVNQVTDYSNSMGTTVPYTHYKIQIPNNEVKLKLSGNYIIKVFDAYNSEKVVLKARFMVVEKLVAIDVNTKQPIDATQRLTSQQIDLKITTNALNISDPYNELTPIIIQNDKPDNSFFGLKPTFIQSNEISYSSPDKLIFDGVNEYRSFEINSIRYISSGILSIDQKGDGFNVQLSPSQNNRTTKYTLLADINGKYKVKLASSDLSDIEADYVWVYFTLPYYDQLSGKEVYVYGELTGWMCTSDNMMQYNFQRQAYELRLMLKQGYYNYRYVVRDSKTGQIDHTFFEGNHYEAENTYQVLIYYKQIGQRYDRLVGYKSINTRNPL